MDPLTSDEFAAYVGIDWSDQKHDVCLRAAGTEKIESSVLAHNPEAIDEWAQRLLQRFGGRAIAVALEQSKGPLIYALMKYGIFVLFPINPQSLAKYRQAFALSRAKDDPTDSALALEMLCKHRDQLRPLRPHDSHTRALAQVTEHRRCLVNDRVRLSNRIGSLLKGYFPQAIEWFGNRDTVLFCDFLITWPTLAKLQRVRPKTLERFFHRHNVRQAVLTSQRLEAIKGATPLTHDPGIIEPSARMVVALATQLKDLLQSIQDFDREIVRLYQSHEDHALFESLPGAGAALAPRLLAAFGSDRDRYQGAEEIITYMGIAPVLERSGQQHWVHWRPRCPTFLRQTFVEWANRSRHYSFWAQAFYQQQRDKGKTHQMALRALAFKWMRILYRCWQDREPYDESRYLMALQRRNSSLLKGIASAP